MKNRARVARELYAVRADTVLMQNIRNESAPYSFFFRLVHCVITLIYPKKGEQTTHACEIA